MLRLLLMFIFGCLISGAAIAQDYLSTELRDSVDELKADAAETPSTDVTVRERARVLWDWVNAYSMTGKNVPVNVTARIRALMALTPDQRSTAGQRRGLDEYIREFTMYDEQPDALGPLTISDQGPFKAGSLQTVALTYTVGTMDMAEGGMVVIARQFISDSGFWQNNSPSAENYISIGSSNSAARFEKTSVPISGMHGGFRGASPQPAFRLSGTALTNGDTITITYGDTREGGGGFRVQTHSSDASGLPVYIDLDASGRLLSLPIPTYAVTGMGVHAIKGFAPSVVGTGEKFEISVRAEDRQYNRATGPIPQLAVMLNGEAYATLAAGDKAIHILSDIAIDEPGVYRFAFASPDGDVSGISNPIWVQENPERRIFWGETHGHCGFAEGQGTAEGYFRFGRDDARLDFLTLSEHDIWLDDYEWKQLNELSAAFTKQGSFIAYPGYEWSVRRTSGGHHNVFFRGTGWKRLPSQEAPRLTDLYLGLHALYDPEDVLLIPHAHQAGDWRSADVYLTRLVEIMSMHGTFEWFGDRYLQHGHEVGFIAASDDHIGHPGYFTGTGGQTRQRGGLAAVYAPELTTDTIFDGLRARNTYATSESRMILDATLNGGHMGQRQAFAESRTLKGRVMGTAGIDTVSLIKNGETIATRQYANTSSSSFLRVDFESESDSTGRDNPRGYRPWRGSLEVTGAHLIGVSTPGFQDARTEWTRRDDANPNRLSFQTATRGRINHLVLELEGAGPDTTINIALQESLEYATPPPRVRPFARLPEADLTYRVGDFEEGAQSRAFQVGRYRDHLTLRFFNPAAPMDQTFEFVDNDDPQHGDYYYLRVRQLDGGLAWSSPWWVGGESRQ